MHNMTYHSDRRRVPCRARGLKPDKGEIMMHNSAIGMQEEPATLRLKQSYL